MQSEEVNRLYEENMEKLLERIADYGEELRSEMKRTIISNTKKRRKTTESIIEKLQRKGREVNVDSMFDCINDIAGIRVICLFVDDVYQICGFLETLPGYTVIRKKDFIQKPKSSGYQSLHLVVTVDGVSVLDRPLKIEIQLRTAAMDYWSVLEYQLQYKKKLENKKTKSVRKRLKQFAVNIAQMDQEMLEIRNSIETI